jgi:catechol 2,3-dioxygenase-like lactoylglutathione lyase family enzyme
MAVQLNHTIVMSRDKRASAGFLAWVLGLPEPVPFGPFLVVQAANGVSLDFVEASGPGQAAGAGLEKITPQHYAFLVSESEFDEIFGRIRERGLPYWADPAHKQPGEINTRDGGRGVYFDDPSGHNLEILTRPYGSGKK